MAVVKNVPLPLHTDDTAVIISGCVQSLFWFAALIADVTVGNDNTAVLKIPVWVLGCGVAQLMVHEGRPDEVVGTVHFADGTCLVKGVALKAGSLGFHAAGATSLGSVRTVSISSASSTV